MRVSGMLLEMLGHQAKLPLASILGWSKRSTLSHVDRGGLFPDSMESKQPQVKKLVEQSVVVPRRNSTHKL